MPNSWKGVIAGFVATVVLSALIMLFNAAGVLKQLDIVEHIDKLEIDPARRGLGRSFHRRRSAVGIRFSLLSTPPSDEDRPRWQKGLMFGVIAWFLMMIIFMPVIGAGLFGWRLGIVEPIGMLGLHLVYGLVIGRDFRFPRQALSNQGQHPAATASFRGRTSAKRGINPPFCDAVAKSGDA